MPRKKATDTENAPVKIPKKRGRKPKGGKIVDKDIVINNDINLFSNVIVHLKCTNEDLTNEPDFLSEMQYNPEIESIESYSINNNKLGYELLNNTNEVVDNNVTLTESKPNNEEDIKMKTIWKKIRDLDMLYKINMIDKKSACFWCTCDYDNPSVYIPKMFMNEKYHVYGNFCSPECACAYLFNEHLNDSIKFERYHLLNYIYCKIYDYNRNIKPAPNPFYVLDKFMGNLSIQEYRKLLFNERLLLVIDKPLTKIMPELHEDNNEHNMMGDYKYMLKRKSEKIVKKDIVSKQFQID